MLVADGGLFGETRKTLKRVMSLDSSSRVLLINYAFLSVYRRRMSAKRVAWFRKQKSHGISGIVS